jgi:hypothetical protein
MDNAEFPQGIFAKAPADSAPDFVKGKLQIKLDEAIDWLKSKQDAGEQWVSLDIKEGRSGKWYAGVNTWKPKGDGKPIPPIADDDMPW